MTLEKMDRWKGLMVLDETISEVKELEKEFLLYLDNAKDTTSLHDEVPMLYIIEEDLERLIKRLKKARKQILATNEGGN